MSHLSGELARVNGRVNEMWKINCACVMAFDGTITEKDAEIEQMTARIVELEAGLEVCLHYTLNAHSMRINANYFRPHLTCVKPV